MDAERLSNLDQLTNIDFPSAGLNSAHRVLADTNSFRQDLLRSEERRVGKEC